MPRAGFAIPRNLPPKRLALPGFNVRGGRRTRYGATQHISVVLTACRAVSRVEGASCELATAVTEVAAR